MPRAIAVNEATTEETNEESSMKQIHQLIGGAGTGKTSRNMQSIEDLVEDGIDPMEILFSSFTKAARQTAAVRAESITGVSASELVSNGWFKTLQAVCYRCLGIKSNQMVTDNKESREWLSKIYGCDFSHAAIEAEDGYVIEDNHSENAISKVLQEWSTARMMLLTTQDDTWPVRSMERNEANRIIEQYERRKYVDGRLDFADLALKFVGIKHDITKMHLGNPECGVPNVAACIFDEYQDTPALLHYVAVRIADSPRVEKVWVSGDPFQSIFNFFGSDHKYLLNGWPYTHTETMQVSYRCATKILELGESTIRKCSDYFDRGIQSTGSVGNVVKHTSRTRSEWLPDPQEDWLVIGRTNYAVSQVTKWLTVNHVPWISSDGSGAGFVGPRKRRVGEVFHKIKTNQEISSSEWGYAIGDIPVSYAGNQLLKRGVKSAATSSDWSCPSMMTPEMLLTNGATEFFLNAIRKSDWSPFDPAFARFAAIVDKHGIDTAVNPKIRAGTIHSVKGDEADNVLLYSKTSGVVRKGQENQRRTDEEHRVWYVGVTRARENLVLFRFNSDMEGYF